MCGIVGYIGGKNVAQVLMNGLRRMEYRGYDSVGIAVLDNNIIVQKQKGKVSELNEIINYDLYNGLNIGIGHTRWATHGEPNDINAHPHLDCHGEIAVVHNGIIENYASLKKILLSYKHVITSDTDTEVLVHLIEYYHHTMPLVDAVQKTLTRVEGTYGIVVMSTKEPDRLVAARNGSPLIIGIGDGEMIIASDASAIVEHTRSVIYVSDGEIIELTNSGVKTFDLKKQSVEKLTDKIDWDIADIEKAGFAHFMLKEIYEQPETITNSFRGRILIDEGKTRLDGLRLTDDELNSIRRIIFIACGTSWHAGLIGEYLIEEYARIPVEVEYASEFRYRSPILDKGDLVIVISQSGETADTLAALREAKARGVKVMGITNVVGSTIARESDGGVYIHAGPEIGVASTKAFTSQITVLILLTFYLGRRKYMTADAGREFLQELIHAPRYVQEILDSNDAIKEIAQLYMHHRNFLYLGRGIQFPVALEGALKLKEISYIHAEGYPAAEMKHGPIALIDENMPVVFIAVKDEVYQKVISNIQEVKARKGKIIAIASQGDEDIKQYADHVLYVPSTRKLISPLLTVIPLQLLAYHIAVMRGCHVDQPRNLAKSVTVE